MKTLEKQFASRVSAFLRRSGLRPTTFGIRALGDPNLIRQISEGRSLTLRTADRILDFIAEYDAGGARARRRPGRRRRSWPRARRTTRRNSAMTQQAMEQTTTTPIRFLRLPEVQDRTGLSRSTIYVRLSQGRFPRPVSLGARAVGWIEAEIEEWIRERIAESRDGDIPASGATELQGGEE